MKSNLDHKRFKQTFAALTAGIQEGVVPGLVFGFWEKHSPHAFQVLALGKRRVLPSSLPMLTDSIFDLASVTKVFATTCTLARFIERGWVSWNTPLKLLCPDAPVGISLEELASHTSGLPAWNDFYQKMRSKFKLPLEEIPIGSRQRMARELLSQVAPEVPPGARTLYSDLGFMWLGFAIEAVSGQNFPAAVKRNLWQPMRLRSAHFNLSNRSVTQAVDLNAVATENCPWRGAVLQGQVHDDNTWAMGGYAGHAGAFAHAEDVLLFASQLLSGFFMPETIKKMWTRVGRPKDATRTPGWDTSSGDQPAMGAHFSKQSVGHLGYTGTSLWIDPEREIAVTLLTNRVHPVRDEVQMNRIKKFRTNVHEALFQDLTDS